MKFIHQIPPDIFMPDGYQERQEKGEPQRQLSKEFVRRWLIEHGFQGQSGQQLPEMSDAYIASVSERYIELIRTYYRKNVS